MFVVKKSVSRVEIDAGEASAVFFEPFLRGSPLRDLGYAGMETLSFIPNAFETFSMVSKEGFPCGESAL